MYENSWLELKTRREMAGKNQSSFVPWTVEMIVLRDPLLASTMKLAWHNPFYICWTHDTATSQAHVWSRLQLQLEVPCDLARPNNWVRPTYARNSVWSWCKSGQPFAWPGPEKLISRYQTGSLKQLWLDTPRLTHHPAGPTLGSVETGFLPGSHSFPAFFGLSQYHYSFIFYNDIVILDAMPKSCAWPLVSYRCLSSLAVSHAVELRYKQLSQHR